MIDFDPYEALGVDKDASEKEIQRVYRQLALKYHPDKNPDSEDAANKFKRIAEAYEILSDKEKRTAYDQRGMSGAEAAGFEGFANQEDIFRQFGDLFGSRVRTRQPGPRRGADLRFRLQIPFLEAALGGKRTVKVPVDVACGKCGGAGMEVASGGGGVCDDCHGSGHIMRQMREQHGYVQVGSMCPSCQGSGMKLGPTCTQCGGTGHDAVERSVELKVPAGIKDGATMRLAGQGASGAFGGPDGDLLIAIDVASHETFTRVGTNNIRSDIRVPLVSALLGGKVDVPTIHGTLVLTVPAGTSSDQTMRLRGQGIQPKSGSPGDHLVRIGIDVPKELTDEAKAALREHLTEEVTT